MKVRRSRKTSWAQAQSVFIDSNVMKIHKNRQPHKGFVFVSLPLSFTTPVHLCRIPPGKEAEAETKSNILRPNSADSPVT